MNKPIVHNFDSEEEAKQTTEDTRKFVRDYTRSYKEYKDKHNGEKMNHYDILMVDENASPEEIKDMKQKLMVMFNQTPKDKMTEAHYEIIGAIKEADLILSDEKKRQQYNNSLHESKEPKRLSVKEAAAKFENISGGKPSTNISNKQTSAVITH
ncbi:MAG: DnaJ domain-containing protein [Pseudomonadota bacterium]